MNRSQNSWITGLSEDNGHSSARDPQLDVDLQRYGVSNTGFRVMEALLHKDPLPVNVIGPKVNLTPGAIGVAVDRLEVRGLVREQKASEIDGFGSLP